MSQVEAPWSDDLFQEWNLLDDRIVWQGPVETWIGASPGRAASGSGFAGLLGQGGAERVAALHEASSTPSGRFDVKYELSSGRARILVEETGKCIRAPDGRLAVVRSRLRRLPGAPFETSAPAHPADGVVPLASLLGALGRMLDEGATCGLLHLELCEADRGDQRDLLRAVSGVLRHGDVAALHDDRSVLAALRGADHEPLSVAAQRIQSHWAASGGGGLTLSAVVGPKFGRNPALLLHRLLTTRDIARARGATGLVCYAEQLVSRDVSLRRVALADDLVAALNSRAIVMAPRALRDCRGEIVGLDLIAEAHLDSGPAELASLRPLYGRLEVAEALDHRIAELGHDQSATSAYPVCVFLSASTASSGWLNLIEALAGRRGAQAGRLIVDLPAHDPLSSRDERREIAARLRQAGCGLSLSGVRDALDGDGFDADIIRLSPLALGDLAYSADARRRVRELVAGYHARGAHVVVPVAFGREAEHALKSFGVALVDGAALDGDPGRARWPAIRAA